MHMRICVFWDVKLCQMREWAFIHSEAAQWLHPEGCLLTQKKSSSIK